MISCEYNEQIHRSFGWTFALVVAIGCVANVATVKEIMKRDEGVVRVATDKNPLSVTETLNVIKTRVVGLLYQRLPAVPIGQLPPETFKSEINQLPFNG